MNRAFFEELDAAWGIDHGVDALAEDHGTLHDYDTAAAIRPATAEERAESVAAAETDGGAGVIRVDGRRCYVQD